jgi:hypothetical protein
MGANWKTTVSGIGTAIFAALTILAALPYELGEVAQVIPPAWKGDIVIAGMVGAFGLRVWNAVVQKDRNVTGGTIMQDTSGNSIPSANKPSLVEMTKTASPLS